MDLYGHKHIQQFNFIYLFQDEYYDVFNLHASMHFVSIIYHFILNMVAGF